ncbi:HU family DNA-binding protein [Catenisphaera adipataccumulans]|jgi:DNA-binding protein HU-beta|uniref:DNA-binding protein HU-beta n=1 Tax=Catenisphaera adipataccumulans TaxID=700500 RepID=A0A7W8D0F6_9FIRM|nr:HU family DNA-binding protein [Catenisphaera adipataccumulans]MBB5183722.1 DNA-binding protein HU-beta [Catenisphaera adipataccumulans]
MGKLVNKETLAQSVAEKCNMSKKDAMKAVNVIFDEMSDALVNEGNVEITSFGKFHIFYRKERMGINPATKEKMMIHSSKLPKFKPSQTLKNKCNETK